jgi:hypothetical protein
MRMPAAHAKVFHLAVPDRDPLSVSAAFLVVPLTHSDTWQNLFWVDHSRCGLLQMTVDIIRMPMLAWLGSSRPILDNREWLFINTMGSCDTFWFHMSICTCNKRLSLSDYKQATISHAGKGLRNETRHL